MKGVFIILDGISDEPCSILKNKTPLEYAKTPNLDEIARHSKIDYCYTVKEGYIPESDKGTISLLGYDSNLVSRGSLEALGLGINLRNGDLAFRCNFATIDDIGKGNIIDRRAGRTLTTKEARGFVKAINEGVKLKFPFEFYSTIQHRGVLVINGGFSGNISGVESIKNKLVFSKPLDDEEDSLLASELVNSFVRQSYEILKRHPINIDRAKKGLYTGNVILCRGAGNEVPRFKKLRGRWMGLGYSPLQIGIEIASGMDVYKMKYPKMKNIDVYGNLEKGLKKAIRYSIKMLKRNKSKYDYFFIHFKETDVPGHDNKPLYKVRFIELLDRRFFSFLRRYIGDGKLVITADHSTACRKMTHTAEPVPVLFYNGGNITESNKRFIEKDSLDGKKILGRMLLSRSLLKK